MVDSKLKKTIDKDSKYYMNTFGTRTPVCFTGGKGMFLFGTDGKKYMDLLGGIAVNILGHKNMELTEALCSQAKKYIHCSNLYYIKEQAELAEKLVNLCPNAGKAFFTNSGAEANEAAIKLARIYFHKQGCPRPKIISAKNSFHGRTLAAITATGQPKYHLPFEPLPKEFVHVPYNDIQALKDEVDKNTCAVMLEIIQGEGGVVSATKEYLEAAQNICRQTGALLIIDEVQTGMGRTGKFFSFEHFDLEPDITTLAKGLGGGVPIGCILASNKVSEAFSPGDHGTTFGGNPLACAAGLAVLDKIEKSDLVNKASSMGDYFHENLERIMRVTKKITQIRGRGLMIGIKLSEPNAVKVKDELFRKGYLVNSIGEDIIRILPPFVIKKVHVEVFCNDLVKILEEEERHE